MSASFLKQRKHKQFKYTPRFSNKNEAEDNSKEESYKKAFASRWESVRQLNSKRKRGSFTMRLLIIILALLLIVMYLLDTKIT